MSTTTPADAVSTAKALQADLVALESNGLISKTALSAPRRRSSSANRALATQTSSLLYPDLDSLGALIQYEREVVKLRAAYLAQQAAKDTVLAEKAKLSTWAGRIEKQGAWDEVNDPVSLEGAEAIPMPVRISDAESLAPFFDFIAEGGSYETRGEMMVQLEPYYEEPYIEFEKGVLYQDNRMDLCKMVVGPQHISTLFSSLRRNPAIKHFLLGNNLIGPAGTRAIASYLSSFPNRIETWYLAGCCIDSTSFTLFVDELIKSESCHNIWLKRNHLGAESADDLARLIIGVKKLRVLDIEQTRLGDKGAERLFKHLSDHLLTGHENALETIYLNADGLSVAACTTLSAYLSHPDCPLRNLYLSCNPIGDAGAVALSTGLTLNKSLKRLMLKSAGIKTVGASAIFDALRNHPSLMALDVGHAYTTEDLGDVRYNYIEDGALDSLTWMLRMLRSLRLLNLGITAMSRVALDSLKPFIKESNLVYYLGSSIHPKLVQSRFSSKNDGVQERLLENVQARYGDSMTYDEFMQGPLRFLISPEDVRFIDSVYRNRDAEKALRGQMVLKKIWEDGDETLKRVMDDQGW